MNVEHVGPRYGTRRRKQSAPRGMAAPPQQRGQSTVMGRGSVPPYGRRQQQARASSGEGLGWGARLRMSGRAAPRASSRRAVDQLVENAQRAECEKNLRARARRRRASEHSRARARSGGRKGGGRGGAYRVGARSKNDAHRAGRSGRGGVARRRRRFEILGVV